LYFLCLLLTSICNILASFQEIWWPSTNACWAKFDLFRRPFLSWIYVPRSLRIAVCLFRLHNFYRIRKERCKCMVQRTAQCIYNIPWALTLMWILDVCIVIFLVYIFIPQVLRHQTMDKVQKYNSFNTNTPSSESYRNYLCE
jgi:hypothetical protein